jgi:dTDP-4-dehydrorhamnose 3,5-epimerase-like enzyme
MGKYIFKSYKKKSGTLVPFSFKKDIPFKTKRVFMIYGNKNFTRGNHAHKKCSQFIVPLFGKMELNCENSKSKIKTTLNYKNNKGYLLKPKTWCKIKFLTNNSIVMVFCDYEYQFKDYIENYKKFLKIIKKK